MAHYRTAYEKEDETLARILYNAFRLNWDFNWWQCVRFPLRKISTDLPASEQLHSREDARLDLHRATVHLAREVGALIEVVTTPDSDDLAAISFWFPPNTRPSIPWMFRSGLVWAACRWGLRGLMRLWRFHSAVDKIYAESLPSLGVQQSRGAYVWIAATDPEHAGHGYAAGLLKWQIKNHQMEHPNVPIYLETSTEHAQRVYERLGFRELGRKTFDLEVDENGCRRNGQRDRAEMINKVKYHTLRVMMLHSSDSVD